MTRLTELGAWGLLLVAWVILIACENAIEARHIRRYHSR